MYQQWLGTQIQEDLTVRKLEKTIFRLREGQMTISIKSDYIIL